MNALASRAFVLVLSAAIVNVFTAMPDSAKVMPVTLEPAALTSV